MENQSGFFELRVFGEGYSPLMKKFFKTYEEICDFLEKNENYLKNKHLLFSMNARVKEDGSAEFVEKGNVFLIDLDSEEAYRDYEKIVLKLQEMGFLPTIISFSGKGLHLLYKLDKPVDKNVWEELCLRLIEFFKDNFGEYNVDEQVKDIARTIRVIGSDNIKYNPPVETKILLPNFYYYSLEEFNSKLPELTPSYYEIMEMIRNMDYKKFVKKIDRIERLFFSNYSVFDLIEQAKIINKIPVEWFGDKRIFEFVKNYEKMVNMFDFKNILFEIREIYGRKISGKIKTEVLRKKESNLSKLFEISQILELSKPKKGSFIFIEKILKNSFTDGRKILLFRLIIPYLANVKKLEWENAEKIINEWLKKCFEKRKSDISLSWIKSAFKNCKRRNIMPMSLSRFLREYSNVSDVKEVIELLRGKNVKM